ncbi:MAG: Holliday junction DNA helicase RuvA [Dehalococcoidales bacterium]|nr:OB-fold domain-containing protein [Dehalococcoidia bacterium]NCG35712.1 Holliday junction DNA helicase RuvA [Dehalococcoidales bacterium]
MISFLEGNIKKFLLNPKRLILLVNGVGYEIHIPEYLSNFFVENSIIENSSINLEIYYHVTERQPKPLLVGFIDPTDKEFFEQLIQVEGIGPVKAANCLVFPINTIAHAIETEDYNILEQMPGIGSRAAQKMVASLKGKVADKVSSSSSMSVAINIPNSIYEDAMEVLVGLGYKTSDARIEINEILNKSSDTENINVENLLREVFKKNRK